MDQESESKRATVHDVARRAGVSLATVDRVLNGRPGVRPETAGKVEEAIRLLDFRRDLSASLLARARDLSVLFLIPAGGNAFMDNLTAAVTRRARATRNERLTIAAQPYHALDPADLVARLDALDSRQTDCAVVVAPDDPAVLKAIDAATRRGVSVITLVSDLPSSSRRYFIGIDNQAAGRTAASLLGRFCHEGQVGIIAGSLALRDHRERFEGFVGVMGREYRTVRIVGPVEGLDDDAQTEAVAYKLLSENPTISGIYNLGAGNAGLVAALGRTHRAGAVRVVAHELSDTTRDALRAGTLDVVLDQNPDGEIRAAIAAARQVALSPRAQIHTDPIEIGIFLRDNLR
jgi:LacI family transcriptional regulator